MIVAAPSSIQDFWGMMNAAIKSDKPVAVRYPRGTSIENKLEKTEDESNLTKSKTLKVGQHVAILVWGPLVHEVLQVAKDSEYAVIDMRMVKPIDYQKLDKIGTECEFIVTVEDGVINGGVGQEVASYIQEKYPSCIVKNIGIPDEFVEQDTPTEIYKNYKMDGKSVVKLCDFLMHQYKEH
jgi:1-deoxy-D-xylulose-5-phosphate synthase